MTDNAKSIVEQKNQWLYQQVEVEHPTKESLAGRSLYMRLQENAVVAPWLPLSMVDTNFDDIYLVDFHRLTVSFSLLQSEKYNNERDKNHIVEFLTQIIYSAPCELYLGYDDGEAVAAAIVTYHNNDVLISDVVVKTSSQFMDAEYFSSQLFAKLSLSKNFGQCYLER